MNTQLLSHALNDLGEKYVAEALEYAPPVRKKRPLFIALAACLSLFIALGLWQFRSPLETVTLSGGETLRFAPLSSVPTNSLDLFVDTRALTVYELEALFPGLSAEGFGIWSGEDRSFLGFEGHLGRVRFIFSATETLLQDTIIEGTETTASQDGVGITAGYFRTRPNSQGKRTVIYYATFTLNDQTFYLENAGEEADKDSVKSELAQALEGLIENGALPEAAFPSL